MSVGSVLVKGTVRKWAVDEATVIEQGFAGTPSKVTAADDYAEMVTGIPAAEHASAYAARMDAGVMLVLEQRWDNVQKRCVEYGIKL